MYAWVAEIKLLYVKGGRKDQAVQRPSPCFKG